MTTASLMPAIAGADPHALRDCMATYQRLVRSLARRFLPGEAGDDGAVQDVFVDLWRSAGRYDGRVSEASFVSMISGRRIIDRLRRSSRRIATEPLEEAVPAATASAEETCDLVMVAPHLDELRPPQREVLMLSVVQGMSHREIADELGMPLGTVKAHARRGMDQLRRSLRGDQIANM